MDGTIYAANGTGHSSFVIAPALLNKAANLCIAITVPEDRIRHLRSMQRTWHARAPEDSVRWFATLPETEQQIMEQVAE